MDVYQTFVISICIVLMTKDFEQILTCLLGLYITAFVNVFSNLFIVFCLFVFLLLSCVFHVFWIKALYYIHVDVQYRCTDVCVCVFMTYKLNYYILPHRSLKQFILHQFAFFLFFMLLNFNWFIFKFTNSSYINVFGLSQLIFYLSFVLRSRISLFKVFISFEISYMLTH